MLNLLLCMFYLSMDNVSCSPVVYSLNRSFERYCVLHVFSSGMASLVLASFPTTMEQDIQELDASSDADLRLALRFRIEKKRVLLHAINAIAHMRKVRHAS